MSVPLSWNALVAFSVAPCIVAEAVMDAAPVIEPVFVMFPLLLFIPPVIDAPPDETVSKPPIV